MDMRDRMDRIVDEIGMAIADGLRTPTELELEALARLCDDALARRSAARVRAWLAVFRRHGVFPRQKEVE